MRLESEGKRDGKENWEIRTQALKHFPRAEKSERGGSKGKVKGGAAARGTLKKRDARVIEGKKIKNEREGYVRKRGKGCIGRGVAK